MKKKTSLNFFLRKRGSIKDVGEELGISYPTVRNKLDKVIKSLGGKVDNEQSRLDILNMLNNGEITAEEAKELLKEVNNDWWKENDS